MLQSIVSSNALNNHRKLAFKSNPDEKPKQTMDKNTKILIGACALATLVIAGICIAKKGKLSEMPTKPKTPDIPPKLDTEPPVKPNAPEVKSPKVETLETPLEKPLEKPIETPVVPDTVAKTELQLLEEATPIEEFKKIGRFEKKKAVLNSGEPFSGNISTSVKYFTILHEFENGVIVKSTKFKIIGESGRALNTMVIKKYHNGEIVEKFEGGILEKYSRDKSGNRVITEYGDVLNGDNEIITTTITKENDAVVYTTQTGKKDVFTRDKHISEYNDSEKSDLICRTITDKKTGKMTNYLVNKKTGEIEELVPFKIVKPAQKGIPAYEYTYNGNFKGMKKLKVLNEDGSFKFDISLYRDGDTSYFNLSEDHSKTLQLIHNNKFGFSKIDLHYDCVYMQPKDPDLIIIKGQKDDRQGTYRITTKEIDGGGYEIQNDIKNILKMIFRNREPINIDKLYEEFNQDLISILQEIHNKV